MHTRLCLCAVSFRSCEPPFVCTLSDSGTLLLLLILMIAISTHTDLIGLNAALQQPALCATWIVVSNIAVALLVASDSLLLHACGLCCVWRLAVVVTKMVVHGT